MVSFNLYIKFSPRQVGCLKIRLFPTNEKDLFQQQPLATNYTDGIIRKEAMVSIFVVLFFPSPSFT